MAVKQFYIVVMSSAKEELPQYIYTIMQIK